jgi:ribosomal protein S18 acetylase RimI-like enzyme
VISRQRVLARRQRPDGVRACRRRAAWGIGGQLIDECVRFARRSGYRKLRLWTRSELDAARRLGKRAGFRVVSKQPHDSFGRKGLVAETWEMKL